MVCLPLVCRGYPLDGYEQTGITRLEGYLFSLATASGEKNIVPGARLNQDKIVLRLKESRINPSILEDSQDPQLERALRSVLSKHYSLALLDLSNPEKPRSYLQNAKSSFPPASLGKLLVAVGVFEALREIYPYQTDSRLQALREAQVTADEFILKDSHEVPFWHKDTGTISFRPIEINDTANLFTFMDWMLSASSNAAASTVMKEIALIKELGTNYINSTPAQKDKIFKGLPPKRVASLIQSSIASGLEFSGLDSTKLRQGSFFTKTANSKIPKSHSSATTYDLLELLIQLERGRLVDTFSSLELKKLLYLTQSRTRFAAHPLLDDSAVFFKSGSFYRCNTASCPKNNGNIYNLMNSCVIVESTNQSPQTHYLLVLSSNEPGHDAVELHRDLAGKIHSVLLANH